MRKWQRAKSSHWPNKRRFHLHSSNCSNFKTNTSQQMVEKRTMKLVDSKISRWCRVAQDGEKTTSGTVIRVHLFRTNNQPQKRWKWTFGEVVKAEYSSSSSSNHLQAPMTPPLSFKSLQYTWHKKGRLMKYPTFGILLNPKRRSNHSKTKKINIKLSNSISQKINQGSQSRARLLQAKNISSYRLRSFEEEPVKIRTQLPLSQP